MISDEEKAKREADVARIKRASDLSEYYDRLLAESGKAGQIGDIRHESYSAASLEVLEIRRRHSEVAEARIAELLGASVLSVQAEMEDAKRDVDAIDVDYLIGRDDLPIRCAVSGVPIADTDYVLVDRHGIYVLGAAIGLSEPGSDGND